MIKVADFGLSEDIYAHNYFREPEMREDESGEISGAVKLPIRWMALESLHNGVFTEKTDVVSVFKLEIHVWDGSPYKDSQLKPGSSLARAIIAVWLLYIHI